MSNLTIREFNSKTIRIRADRYVCLTDMAKASGKLFADWKRLKTTESYLETLSESLGIPITELIEVNVGNLGDLSGTWGHPKVALRFAQWCKNNQNKIKVFPQVYAIADTKHGVFKLGISINPWERLKTIQTSYPFDLIILNTSKPNRHSASNEKLLHHLLSDFRLNGEWFDLTAYQMIDWSF